MFWHLRQSYVCIMLSKSCSRRVLSKERHVMSIEFGKTFLNSYRGVNEIRFREYLIYINAYTNIIYKCALIKLSILSDEEVTRSDYVKYTVIGRRACAYIIYNIYMYTSQKYKQILHTIMEVLGNQLGKIIAPVSTTCDGHKLESLKEQLRWM